MRLSQKAWIIATSIKTVTKDDNDDDDDGDEGDDKEEEKSKSLLHMSVSF